MRIISKFNDYYDGASGYGVDMTVVYDRAETIVEHSQLRTDILAACAYATHDDRFTNMYKYSEHDLMYVGVAGKIYVGLTFEILDGDQKKQLFAPLGQDPSTTLYVWRKNNLTEEQLRQESTTSKWQPQYNRTVGDWFRLNDSRRVHENIELFTKHNIVNFAVTKVRGSREPQVLLNPCLQRLGFQRMMDGFTLFQEISMFVTGVLAQKDQMTHVATDKELLYARGHDDKSFKTPPTKKR